LLHKYPILEWDLFRLWVVSGLKMAKNAVKNNPTLSP
jgi:hypothetical protein